MHGRYLLRPSPELNELVLGIVGRGQALHPVRIHSMVFMSNHWHALLSVDHAEQLAGFMGYVNGNLAREVGRLYDWPQRFWERRYQSIVVADEAASIERLTYLFRNGCKEGLVNRPVDWPGVSSVRALTSGKGLIGTRFDRSAEYYARRRGERVAHGQFATQYQVHLSQLPCWQDLSAARHRAACADIASHIEAETRAERLDSGQSCVAMERLMSLDPHARPDSSARSPAPLVHASSPSVRNAFRRAFAAFVDAYRAAAKRLRAGLPPDFPAGAFPARAPFLAAAPA